MKIPSFANNNQSGALADRIRVARKRATLSQTKLARTVGVSASAVAQWEHPRGTQPSLENLVRIVEVTGASLECLIVGGVNRKGSALGKLAEAITDAKGNTAHVTIGNVMQSNGVIHVIDKVLMP